MQIMKRTSIPAVLERLAAPVIRCLTPDVARELVKLHIDRKTQAHLDNMAEKCTDGRLTSEERAEYQTYVAAIDFLTILQIKARGLIAKTQKAT